MMRIAIAIMFTSLVKALAQDTLAANHPIRTQIQNMNFAQYVGKPADTLIAHLPFGYTEIAMVPNVKFTKAGHLAVHYAENTYVYRAAQIFSHTNPE